jgi:hypothetical protein
VPALSSAAVVIDTRVSKRWIGAALGLWLGACGSDGERPSAWDPEGGDGGTAASTDAGQEGTTAGDAGEGDGSTDGSACMPGQARDCTCLDGTAGEQACTPSGSGFGPCECDDAATTADETGTTGDEPPDENVVCYPGQTGDFTTCLPLHAFDPLPAGYEYPGPLNGDPNYRPPVALLDLQEVDPGTWLAPNFQLGEIAQLAKGRYAVVQVHAIVSLQALRNQVGALGVNSGYRSPAYNASIPGSATYSRHMYGDAYDLNPLAASLATLENACTAAGGMLVEYTSHVHCDFRFDPVDEEFYGPVMAGRDLEPPVFQATLVQGDDGRWRAPAEGFDEGEPQRRWTARDGAGQVIATAIGAEFLAPAGAATVEVRVGAQVVRAIELP